MNSPSDPFKFQRTGKITRNRTVLAAMTNKQSHKDGTLSDAEIGYYTEQKVDLALLPLPQPMYPKMDSLGTESLVYLTIFTLSN